MDQPVCWWPCHFGLHYFLAWQSMYLTPSSFPCSWLPARLRASVMMAVTQISPSMSPISKWCLSSLSSSREWSLRQWLLSFCVTFPWPCTFAHHGHRLKNVTRIRQSCPCFNVLGRKGLESSVGECWDSICGARIHVKIRYGTAPQMAFAMDTKKVSAYVQQGWIVQPTLVFLILTMLKWASKMKDSHTPSLPAWFAFFWAS